MAVGSEVSVSGVGDTAHSFYLSHEEWWRWWGGGRCLVGGVKGPVIHSTQVQALFN